MLTGWYNFDRAGDPFDELRRRAYDLFSYLDEEPRSGWRSSTWPRANLYDGGEAFVITLPVPGVSAEDLHIDGTAEALTVTGRRQPRVPEGFSVHRQERVPVEFRRTIALPAKVEVDGIEASLKDGILSITLPKLPELKPRSIQVQVG